jgi:hypothetical protein
MLAMALTIGCSSSNEAAQNDKIDALERRVTSLERRLGGDDKGSKRKGRKAPPANEAAAAKSKTKVKGGKAPAAEKATVRVDTDVAVHLLKQRKRFDIPGPVPPGTYKVMATFPGAKAEGAGSITLAAASEVTLTCDPDAKLCKVD